MSKTNVVLSIPQPGEFKLIEKPYPQIKDGYGIIRTEIAPICLEGSRIWTRHDFEKFQGGLQSDYAAAANCSFGVGWSNQEVMGVKAGDTVLVGGIGFIAMGHIISALYRNATVIALVRNKYREDLLRQMGVEHFIDPNDEDWLEKVTALTYNGQGVDHAIECSGAPFYQEKLMAAVRLYGTVNFSGHIPGKSLNLVPLEHIINPMHTLMGQHDVRMRDREGLVRALCNREVQRMIDVMVTHEFPMSRAGEAFDVQVSKQCGKVYLHTQQ